MEVVAYNLNDQQGGCSPSPSSQPPGDDPVIRRFQTIRFQLYHLLSLVALVALACYLGRVATQFDFGFELLVIFIGLVGLLIATTLMILDASGKFNRQG